MALERGRARGLGDALARDRADLERIQEKDPEAYQALQPGGAGIAEPGVPGEGRSLAEGKALPPCAI